MALSIQYYNRADSAVRISDYHVDNGIFTFNARAGADFFRDDILLLEN